MAQSNQKEPTISVRNLTYKFQNGAPGLNNVNVDLPAGSRTLLIGGRNPKPYIPQSIYSQEKKKQTNKNAANGAGKTTLLRLLAGKRLAPTDTISVGGTDPFKDGLEGVTYLGVEWVLNQIVRTDMDVPTLLASVGGNAYGSPGRTGRDPGHRPGLAHARRVRRGASSRTACDGPVAALAGAAAG